LRPQVGDIRNIQSFDIDSFDAAVDIIGKDPEKWRPKTRETADHSLPFCTAAALMDGDVTLATFDADRLTDATLLELVAKIKIHRDDKLSARYPAGIPNRLRITMKDGRKLEKEVEFPRGHARNPMTDAEVEKKFRTVVEPKYGADTANKILKTCWNLESLTSPTPLIEMFKK
jgi:2-methylcitrate dehydratase